MSTTIDEVCTACLCTGRKLYFIGETGHYHLYSQILNEIPVYDFSDVCVRVCWECRALLRRLSEFKALVKRSYVELLQHVHQNIPPTISSLLRMPHLEVRNELNINYYPDAEVKDEPQEQDTHFDDPPADLGDDPQELAPPDADDVTQDEVKLESEPTKPVEDMFVDEENTKKSKKTHSPIPSSDEDEEMLNTEFETMEGIDNLLPKTKWKYITTYDNFIKWRKNKKTKSFSEEIFLEYFEELATKYKASSLWSFFSMIRSVIQIKNGIDLKSYTKLISFIKKYSRVDGSSKKKGNVLSAADIEKFLKEAPDDQYLATKVVLIFGINGGCKRQELVRITTQDIQDLGELLIVKLRSRNNMLRSQFTVMGPFYDIVKKYQSLRCTKVNNDRFFQNFQKGRCTKQNMGINKLGSMPKEIARFLNLPDPDTYTSNTFKRTSVKWLASGADILKTMDLKTNNNSNIEKSNEVTNGKLSKNHDFVYVDVPNNYNKTKTDFHKNISNIDKGFEPASKKFCTDKPSTSNRYPTIEVKIEEVKVEIEEE